MISGWVSHTEISALTGTQALRCRTLGLYKGSLTSDWPIADEF